MGRPKRNETEERISAVEEYQTMRRVDEELLGLADDIDAAVSNGFRPERDELPADPPKAGVVRRYFVSIDELKEAWGDEAKLRALILRARGDG